MLSSFLRRPLRINEFLTHCYSPIKEIAVNRVSRTHRMSGWFCQNLFNARRLLLGIGARSVPGSWSGEELTGMAKSQTFPRHLSGCSRHQWANLRQSHYPVILRWQSVFPVQARDCLEWEPVLLLVPSTPTMPAGRKGQKPRSAWSAARCPS